MIWVDWVTIIQEAEEEASITATISRKVPAASILASMEQT
jgi:hypothetical protein